jgi:pimeloyl-ACP methyl ester carboxylesterase
VALLAQLNVESVDWIGTSMGALLGMMFANQEGHPIRRMVINDIGPFVSAAALQRIKDYVTVNPGYSDWDTYVSAFRKNTSTFGLQTEEEWDYFIKVSTTQDEKGQFLMNYDPKIAFGLESAGHITDLNLWALWPKVDMPLLILRGAESDVLLPQTLDQMMVGKQATAITFQNVGHAPALMNSEQIKAVKDWFLSNR